jgi:hypothetical protein
MARTRAIDVFPVPRSPNIMICIPGVFAASIALYSKSLRPDKNSGKKIGRFGVKASANFEMIVGCVSGI